MEINELIDSLKFLKDEENLFCDIYVVINKEFKKLKVEENTAKNIALSFSKSILNSFIDNIKLKSIDDYNDEEAKAIYYFEEDNLFENLKNLIYLPEEIEEIENFDFNKIDFLIIKIAINETNSCYVYKKLAPIHLLKSNFLTSLLSIDNGTLKEYNKNILKLDNNFHFLSIDDKVFVMNFNILEKHLKYDEVIMQKAQKTIEILETIEFLDDLEKIKELSVNKAFAKKIHNIHKSPVIDIMKNNPSKVEIFINNHNELREFFDIISGNLKLKKQTKKNVDKLIKLLNDDLIKSELTEIMYETLNKEKLK